MSAHTLTQDQAEIPLSWLGDAERKAKTLEFYDGHIAADTLTRGCYAGNNGSEFRGCHIGCVLHDMAGLDAATIKSMSEEARLGWVERVIGQPAWLTTLTEQFFECLPVPRNQEVSRAILAATPVGVDLTPVRHGFLIWVLTDPQHGSRQYADGAGKAATDAVAALLRRALAGDPPTPAEWMEVRVAARATAEDAWDARDAAWDAAVAAAESTRAAAWAAGDAAMEAQAAALIRLLKEVQT